MYHAQQKVHGVFGGWLGGRLAFRKRWHDGWGMPPAVVPRTRVRYLAVAILPELRFRAGANEREFGAAEDRNVRAPDDFEQAQGVRQFLIAPLVPARYGNAQHFHLRRLNHGQQRLHIAAARPGAVFVDDDFAAWLGPRGGRRQERERDDFRTRT